MRSIFSSVVIRSSRSFTRASMAGLSGRGLAKMQPLLESTVGRRDKKRSGQRGSRLSTKLASLRVRCSAPANVMELSQTSSAWGNRDSLLEACGNTRRRVDAKTSIETRDESRLLSSSLRRPVLPKGSKRFDREANV